MIRITLVLLLAMPLLHAQGVVQHAVPGPRPRFVTMLEAGHPQVLVTYGTSLTAVGAWVDQFATVLEQQFPGQAEVINGAQGGANSDWGVASLDTRVLAHQPDTVFIEFSVNDAVARRRTSVAHARTNLVNMLDRILAQDPDTEIILQVMNPAVGRCLRDRPELPAYNDMYREVAKARGFRLIDHYPNWQRLLEEDPKRFQRYVPDSVHPVRAGALAVITPHLLQSLQLAAGQPEQSTAAPCWRYLLHISNHDKQDGVTLAELQATWAKYFTMNDQDEDGALSADEFRPASLFQALDTDADKRLSPAEYHHHLGPVFQGFDRDGDGEISREEIPHRP